MPTTTHTGGCHCGQVRYTVTLDLANAVSCNCSHCTKRGFILSFVSPEQFRLESGGDILREYKFNKKMISHLFCPDCGIESFARGKAPDGSQMVAVNVCCLDDYTPGSLNPQKIDGKSF